VPNPQSTDRLDRVLASPWGSHRRTWPRKWWLHLLLFLLTGITTTAFGFVVEQAFKAGRGINLDALFDGYVQLARLDPRVWSGLYFSVPLLLILLAHEFGHYIACQRAGVEASLPYFLPSPLLLGTCGAFIRIRSPIYSRKSLFDIGVSGPIAGFVVLLPFLFAGILMSRVVPFPGFGTLSFGTPLIMRLAEWVCFGHAPVSRILLHPLAMAAWAGLLATAMNLLPMGQLDGGHILYAAFGDRWHRIVSIAFVGVLVALGFIYRAWWVWAGLMFFFGRRHPLVYDQTPLRGWRVALSVCAFSLFVLSIAVVPVSVK
jgi:membrane-associated protease RseP (regulator of RpoE activity)